MNPHRGQAEVAEQIFEQGDLLVLLGHRRSGDRLCGLTRAQSSVTSYMTLSKIINLCRSVSL